MIDRKGILLAGGSGSRLRPTTAAVSKQLLPVYDKPLVYYPLSTLMLAGIREILLITAPEESDRFRRLLGNGQQWGISIQYAVQEEPRGIADALIIGRQFLNGFPCCLILGDNIYYGHGLTALLKEAARSDAGATVFAYEVTNPSRYGVVAFDDTGLVCDIVEKPDVAPSHYAVTGLYFYDSTASDLASNLRPSSRGELEITDINKQYLEQERLHVVPLGRGFAWLDTGTHNSLLAASNFVKTIEERQGLKIACLEEIAFREGLIGKQELASLAADAGPGGYGEYLRRLAARQ